MLSLHWQTVINSGNTNFRLSVYIQNLTIKHYTVKRISYIHDNISIQEANIFSHKALSLKRFVQSTIDRNM